MNKVYCITGPRGTDVAGMVRETFGEAAIFEVGSQPLFSYFYSDVKARLEVGPVFIMDSLCGQYDRWVDVLPAEWLVRVFVHAEIPLVIGNLAEVEPNPLKVMEELSLYREQLSNTSSYDDILLYTYTGDMVRQLKDMVKWEELVGGFLAVRSRPFSRR